MIVPAVVPEHLQLPTWGAHAWQQEAEGWLDESSREINLGDEDRPMWNLSARGRHVVTAVLEATSQNAGLRTGAGDTYRCAGDAQKACNRAPSRASMRDPKNRHQ